MPLYDNARAAIVGNLKILAAGERAKMVAIGYFTNLQLRDLNVVRRGLELYEIENSEILFIGRHLYMSRVADGYSIEDMFFQINSALSFDSKVLSNPKMTALQNEQPRVDEYGNTVFDRAIFECTQRKPRAELFSVIPKGDTIKPKMIKAPPAKEGPFKDDPG